MTIIEGLRAFLVAQPSITTLVGTRIRPTQADENDALPYALLFIVSDPSLYHMGGATGIAQSRVQIDSYGATPFSAFAVSEVIKTALSGYAGLMGTVAVRRCHKANRDGANLGAPSVRDGSQVGKHRVRMDFMIDYVE